MPVADGTIIYTAEGIVWILPNVEMWDTATAQFIDVSTVTTFTYIVTDMNGTSVSNGNMVYTGANGNWYATITTPATNADYHLHATIVKNSTTGKFHDKFTARSLF